MDTRTHSDFAFSRLDAYQVGLQLAAEVRGLLDQIPRGYGPLGDQLRRAVMSTCLNLTEGAARQSTRDKHNRFTIAHAECGECMAALELASVMRALQADDVREAMDLSDRLSRLLRGLVKRYSPS